MCTIPASERGREEGSAGAPEAFERAVVAVEEAVEWADAPGDVSMFAEQTLAGETVRRLRWCLERQSLRFRFDKVLNELDRGLRRDGHASVDRVATLCATGASHRMFQSLHWGRERVDLAGRRRLTGALYEALRPSASAQLAPWDRDGGRTDLRALASF